MENMFCIDNEGNEVVVNDIRSITLDLLLLYYII